MSNPPTRKRSGCGIALSKVLRDERGFSVAEIIIAIASLALVSVFILEMFIIAARVNRRAQYTDRAQLLVNSCLEQFSGSRDPLALDKYPQLQEAELSTLKDGTLRAILNMGEGFAPEPEETAKFRLIADVLFEEADRLPLLPAALGGNGPALGRDSPEGSASPGSDASPSSGDASPQQRTRMLSLSVSIIQLDNNTDPLQVGFGTTIRYEQDGDA